MTNINELLQALNSDETSKNLQARRGLLALGSQVIPHLVGLMQQTQNDRLSWRAAVILAELNDPGTQSVFLEALDSPHPIVRQVAAQALGKFHDTRVVPQLLNHLHDPFSIAQMWVIESLGELGDSRAVEPLVALLSETDSDTIQQSILRALGRIGDRVALSALVPFFNSPSRHVRSRSQEVYEQLLKRQRGDKS
jgi:HEAT repeat protein